MKKLTIAALALASLAAPAHAQYLFQPIPQPYAAPQYQAPQMSPFNPNYAYQHPVAPPPGPMPMMVYPMRPTTGGFGPFGQR
jgi:hypothetical protein